MSSAQKGQHPFLPLLEIYFFSLHISRLPEGLATVLKGARNSSKISRQIDYPTFPASRTKPLQQLTIKSAALQRQADRPQAGGD